MAIHNRYQQQIKKKSNLTKKSQNTKQRKSKIKTQRKTKRIMMRIPQLSKDGGGEHMSGLNQEIIKNKLLKKKKLINMQRIIKLALLKQNTTGLTIKNSIIAKQIIRKLQARK